MGDSVEDVEFLVGSETRVQILTELATADELSTTQLRDRIDSHRTSINRNLDALLDRGWIRETNHHYRIDPSGKLITDDFLSLIDSVRFASRLQPFLEWIDASIFDFDISLFADAEIWTAEPGDPWAMVNQHVKRLQEMDEGYVMTPVTGVDAKRTVCERVVEHGACVHLIVSPAVIETFRSNPNYTEYFNPSLGSDTCRYWIYDSVIPFYLGVIDGVVQIGVDEDGEPRALLESENEEVREWAERTLDEYKARSTPVTAE